MTDGLYLRDAYVAGFSARVVAAEDGSVELDRTAFYPTGGGQPCDRGVLTRAGSRTWSVTETTKADGRIIHRLGESEPPSVGDAVDGKIDWDRRYAHMRYHTALHVLSGVVFQRFGSGITGGQISEHHARMDFSLPEFQRAVAEELVREANAVVARNIPVHVRFIDRAAAESYPQLVRVAEALGPKGDTWRLIDIEGFDVQADGGTHVGNTREVGSIVLDRVENKGARNKRLYVRLAEPT